jgi:hypothetical protein
MAYIKILKNNNQEQFNELISGIVINSNVKDITACFHPNDIKEFPGVYAMHSYNEAVKKNNNSFNRVSKITQEVNNGGMIVLSSDINVIGDNEDNKDNKAEGTNYQRSFGKEYISSTIDNYISEKNLDGIGHTIGKNFSGRYVKNGQVYDENSFTIDLADIDSKTLLDIAADLAHNFQQKEVLVRDFNVNKTYFVDGNR